MESSIQKVVKTLQIKNEKKLNNSIKSYLGKSGQSDQGMLCQTWALPAPFNFLILNFFLQGYQQRNNKL